jgi:hypothetical protein
VEQRFGTSQDVSKCSILAQSNSSSFARMRATGTKSEEGRKELVERHLALDKNQHMAAAIEASAKGLAEARKACQAAIKDKNRPDLKPRCVTPADLDLATEDLAARKHERDDVDAAMNGALDSIRDVGAAKRAFNVAPASADALLALVADAEREQRATEPLDGDETAELASLPVSIHEVDLHLAAMGAAPESAESDLEAARVELTRAEADLAASKALDDAPSATEARAGAGDPGAGP